MSLYELQKLVRDVNRDPAARSAFFDDDEAFIGDYDLTAEERQAVLDRDYGALYAAGVHGLILRPFSLLHQVGEPEYLAALQAVRPLRANPETGELA